MDFRIFNKSELGTGPVEMWHAINDSLKTENISDKQIISITTNEYGGITIWYRASEPAELAATGERIGAAVAQPTGRSMTCFCVHTFCPKTGILEIKVNNKCPEHNHLMQL